jgi:hypothetical protein
VEFHHGPPSPPERPPAPRSGNPGYRAGLPLLWAAGPAAGLRVWGAGRGQRCGADPGLPLLAGQDSLTGCLLTLAAAQLAECGRLAEAVARLQGSLAPRGAAVGRGGAANGSLAGDWVGVLHGEDGPPGPGPGRPEVSCLVPSLQRVTVLHTADPVLGLRVVAVRAALHWEAWARPCTSLSCPALSSFQLRTQVAWIEVPAVWHLQNTSRCLSVLYIVLNGSF